MRWLHVLIFAGLAASASAASHPNPYTDLADRARSLPPEFAADALLRIVGAPGVTDIAWQRQVIEDAFHIAAGGQQPFARHSWNGRPTGPLDKAYAQGLDVCTLQCRAVHAMLAVDYKKARELFFEMPPPRLPRISCDDSLVDDVSIFYTTAAEVAARAFSLKEIAQDEPFHLLLRYAADITSPVQVAPVASMLSSASIKHQQLEALVDSLAGAIGQLGGDDRSFSAAIAGGSDAALGGLPSLCASHQVDAHPLVDAWHAYVARHLNGARCADSAALAPAPSSGQAPSASVDGKAKPTDECHSPECLDLGRQLAKLVIAPNGQVLSVTEESTGDWGARLRQYLSALTDWSGDDDPAECFAWKSHYYSLLFDLAPDGPGRDLVLSNMLAWLQQNSFQYNHRVEWFYPANALIIRAFANSATMKTTVRQLRQSADPVIALFAQLEQLFPRSVGETFGLL